MYKMMMKRNEVKEFRSIQSCVSAMRENGYKHRTVYFLDGDTMFTQKISIDESGIVTVGRKKAEKVFTD